MRLAAAAAVAASAVFVQGLGPSAAAASCTTAGVRAVAYAGSARSDIDADGVHDRIWIARRGSCWFVLARTRQGLRVAPLRQDGLEAGYWDPTSRLPALGRHADIDGRPGAEIFVVVDGGASTSAYGLFSLRGDRLLRLRKPHGWFTDAFVDGGSGGRILSFGCVRRGLVVQGVASTQDGVRYSGTREFYRVVGTTFSYERRADYRGTSGERLRRYAEMSRDKFARCSR